MYSLVQPTNNVVFPAFTGERIYMREFHKGVLPSDLKHWQPTVSAMLDGVEFDGACFLMVDQALVKAGTTHRRPGAHVDGHWLDSVHGHGRIGCHSTPGHGMPLPGRHYIPRPSHQLGIGESLILASDVMASRAYIGEYDPVFGEGGDCSHMDLSGMDTVDMYANIAWQGDVAFIHESLPVAQDVLRTVVRLNVRH